MKIRLSCFAEENLEIIRQTFLLRQAQFQLILVQKVNLTFSVTDYRSRGAQNRVYFGIVVHRANIVKIGAKLYIISLISLYIGDIGFFFEYFENTAFGYIIISYRWKFSWLASLRVAHIRLWCNRVRIIFREALIKI